MINIHMYSSALSVKGQGVGSAYSELINLLQKYFPDKLKITINKFGKADISHYHTIDPLFYLETFLPIVGIKVGYVHFLPETLEGSLQLPWLLKKILYKYLISFYKRMDQIVVVNPIFIKQLERYGILRDRITYIPNFVSKSEFFKENKLKKIELRRQFHLDNKFTVISVGQIQLRKGIYDFIKLANLHPEMNFIWVGGFSFGKITDGYSNLKGIINNPPKNIKFTGIVDRKKMNDYYNVADLFFLPSYNELFPMSILEAFNVGLPVLLRDLDLYKYIINGYYEGAKDLNDMNSKLTILSKNDKLLKNLKNKSSLGATYYSEKRLANIWLNYYSNLIKDRT